MVELFVPKIIDQLTDVAFKQIGERVSLALGVQEEVQNLTFKLTIIKRVLQDAERRKLNDNDVEVWLEKLEDITYEMEDVLDDWNIKVDKPRNLDQGAQVNVSRMPTLLNKIKRNGGSIGHEFYGLPDDGHDDDDFKAVAFPSLKELHMSLLQNWERWEDISEGDEEKIKNGAVSIMPRLETLYIDGCIHLEALPNRLLGKASSLKEIQVFSCGKRLKEKYSDKNGGDWMKISHIPTIRGLDDEYDDATEDDDDATVNG